MVGFAARQYLAMLQGDGTTRGMLDRMFDFRRLNEVVGTEGMLQDGDRYKDL